MTSEQALRKIRSKIFSYPDNKQDQADRVLAYLKARMLRYRKETPESRGPYSGLTRAELRKTRTCETDWY
mgnify:CR=1 FL=1